jgi:probable H4MPT-linked C1 transfer pathway protein
VQRTVVGWDIGGAHVKAARVTCGVDALRLDAAAVRPFELWKAPERLADILQDVATQVGTAPAVALTMTAELCDCFPTKRAGVVHVLEACARAMPECVLWVLDVRGAWLRPAQAARAPLRVAAANWAATARLAAWRYPHTILVDVGSTTTDLIPIEGGTVRARGTTDPSRLACGELVYTGGVRTDVSAVVDVVPLRGRWCRVAAESFAVTGDVYLVLGRLTPADYTCEPPDGGPRTVVGARRRLARVVAADTEMLTVRDIHTMAQFIHHRQVTHITDALLQVLSLMRAWPPMLTVTGTGKFLGEAAAARLGLPVVHLETELALPEGTPTSAVAVAWWLDRSRHVGTV